MNMTMSGLSCPPQAFVHCPRPSWSTARWGCPPSPSNQNENCHACDNRCRGGSEKEENGRDLGGTVPDRDNLDTDPDFFAYVDQFESRFVGKPHSTPSHFHP